MRFVNPVGLWALVLGVPIVALHVLRARRQDRVVSSTLLWRSVTRPITATVPWRKLRFTRLLALQLVAVLLFAFALAQPVRLTSAPLARHTVFIFDVSGSMAARDGDPDRLASARILAGRLRSELPAGGLASVVSAGPEPRVLLSASPDRGSFDSAMGRLRVVAGQTDWPTAFSLAAGLEAPGAPVGFILLSDGRLSVAEQRTIPIGTVWKRVGTRATNRAITRLSVEPRPGGGSTAHVTVANTGGPRAAQPVRIDVDGRTVARFTVDLRPGASVSRSLPVPTGDSVEAFLSGTGDLLPVDDRAVAVASGRRAIRVLAVGPEDPFLDRLLAALPGVQVDRRASSRPAGGYDLAIYDRVAVPSHPEAPFLAIAPPGGLPGLPVGGAVDQPAITLVRTEAPVLAGLDLSAIGIASAQRAAIPVTADADVLIGSEDTPLLVQGHTGGRPFAWFTFRFEDSTLPLDVAFPLLGDRLIRTLAGAEGTPPDLRVGQPLPLPPSDRSLSVISPSGTGEEVPAGGAAPVADRPGFWTVREAGKPDRTLAVNPDPAESSLEPASQLPIALTTAGSGGKLSGQRPWLRWVLLLLAIVLALEWWEGRRNRGVPAAQWRWARATRAAIAVGVAIAALGLSVPRSGKSTNVLFLVDGSDSVGVAGEGTAVAWVRRALDHQPAGSRAGVAVMGADARLEVRPVKVARLGDLSAKIIRSRTNLATGLRLAEAVLPSTDRRRVVLLSDGRATDGDVLQEARRLGASGTRIDVVAIEPDIGPDAAVSELITPAAARVGEAVPVRAVITSTSAGEATVRLTADDAEVATRTVVLRAGDTVVDFPAQRPSVGGIVRYRVDVRRSGDLRTQNDVAFSATEVSGPPRVLVVAGQAGDADSLVAALRAQQITVDAVEPTALPSLDRLAGYAATVLVDVDAATLAADQVGSLSAAVRELGRGLVVIGGEHTYGVGGYRGSDLEALLPVESDVLDPKRRLSVAEVLAIDTSGSMGACHCNGSASGPRLRGGVDKTDISRSGAAQAIDALNSTDQVGVLAFDTSVRWAIPLAPKPTAAVVRKQLASLVPTGGTDLTQPLLVAAERLKAVKAKLKHVVLFTDGFTDLQHFPDIDKQAAMLYSEGITVSVVATGEGASEQLHDIANAGHGRFYPGTDLLSVPQILTTEAVIASRTFINEGSFVPEVVGAGAPVRTLTTSPPLLGYVATTARPQAATWLRVGKEHDPLLASWRIGLGRVTAWTSDASNRWSQEWARWDGYPAFWSAVVKDTFAPAGGGGASMRVERNSRGLHVTVEGGIGFPDDSKATLRVATAAGAERTVALDRAGADAFVADIDTATAGSYAMTATVTDAKGAAVATASRLASQPYSNEYRPARADVVGLRRISAASGGRGEITPEEAFRSTNLPAGHSHFRLTGLLLWLAALLFPVDAALRRLTRRRPAVPTVDGRPLPAPPVTTPSDARPPFVPLTPRPAPGTGGAPASRGRRRRRFRYRLSR